MENILNLKDKLINKAILEWINSIDSMNPEDVYIIMEDLQEKIKEL